MRTSWWVSVSLAACAALAFPAAGHPSAVPFTLVNSDLHAETWYVFADDDKLEVWKESNGLTTGGVPWPTWYFVGQPAEFSGLQRKDTFVGDEVIPPDTLVQKIL